MKLYLRRLHLRETHTLGIIYSLQLTKTYPTLELGWKENQKNISCIPTGTYPVKIWESPKFGKCFLVENVPDRSSILIHAGNTKDDTQGCILIGTRFNQNMIQESRIALNSLLSELEHCKEITLEVA